MTKANDTLDGWLLQQGLEGTSQEELLEGYCRQLLDLGVPLMRLHVAQSAFHPKYGGLGFDWKRDTGVTREHYQYTDTPIEEWLRSPFYHVLANAMPELRRRLDQSNDTFDFPILDDLRAQGATDYFVASLMLQARDPGMPVDPNNTPEGLLISWTSDAPGGFTDTHLDRLRSAQPFLGLALKSAANRQMASDLLRVYLGRDAGRRVMSGELRRGSLQTIDAVIWFFDLTGFTTMAERLPGTELIDMLNGYFALAVEEVQGAGGHVLKFMGDGMLVMFDCGGRRDDADAALAAVVSLRRRLEVHDRDRRDKGLPVAGSTIALHAGQIMYGNIGAENRLDFTAIGPAVNLTARLSGMHRSVGQDVILSAEVRNAATPGRHDLVSLGRYMLRGVAEPRELFTVFEPTADR